MAVPNQATVLWALFGFRGRIGRQTFILGQLFMLALFAVIVARIVAVEGNEGATVFWGIAFLLLAGISLVSSVALCVKRLHDLSLPGILAALVFVPTLNMLFVIALMVVPSRQEVNEHGPPPFGPAGQS